MSRRRRRKKAEPPVTPELAGQPGLGEPAVVWWHAWLPLLVVLAAVVVFANGMGGAFVFDDIREIVQGYRLDLGKLDVVLGGYATWSWRRPWVYLSLAINHAIAGEAQSTVGYHVFNLAVHITAGLALFGVVRRSLLTPRLRARWASSASTIATAVAVLWVVHPLQTQSVTYIIQRTEAMMALGYLLTLYCVIRSGDSDRPELWYVGATAASFFGMGSKVVMMTVIVTALLYDRVFLSRALSAQWPRRLRLYGGILSSYILLFRPLLQLFAPKSSATSVGVGVKDLTTLEYLYTQAGVILHYLRLSFWPDVLCLDYDWGTVESFFDALPAGLAILLMLGATVWALVRVPSIGFVAAFFFIVLSPTSSFMKVRDVIFEHRMYLPLASVVTLVVVGGHWVLHRVGDRQGLSLRARGMAGAVLVALVATALGARTIDRNRDYRSMVAMCTDVAKKSPKKSRAHANLGIALAGENQHEEALVAYDRAIALDANNVRALYNRAIAMGALGRLDEAVEAYRDVLAIAPGFWQASYNLGQSLGELGRHEEAIAAYRQSLSALPEHAEARIMLANALAKLNRHEEAIVEFTRAAHVDNRFVEPIIIARAHYNRGNSLYRLGRLDEALDALPDGHQDIPSLCQRPCRNWVCSVGAGRASGGHQGLSGGAQDRSPPPSICKRAGRVDEQSG